MIDKYNYERENAWGLLVSIDLQGCDPEIIRNADKIREYVVQLCNLIDVKPFGPCTVVHFGEKSKIAGYSMTQLIETSLVSGHFANETNAAYLDIFSCKYYSPEAVADFSKTFFKSRAIKVNYLLRR